MNGSHCYQICKIKACGSGEIHKQLISTKGFNVILQKIKYISYNFSPNHTSPELGQQPLGNLQQLEENAYSLTSVTQLIDSQQPSWWHQEVVEGVICKLLFWSLPDCFGHL